MSAQAAETQGSLSLQDIAQQVTAASHKSSLELPNDFHLELLGLTEEYQRAHGFGYGTSESDVDDVQFDLSSSGPLAFLLSELAIKRGLTVNYDDALFIAQILTAAAQSPNVNVNPDELGTRAESYLSLTLFHKWLNEAVPLLSKGHPLAEAVSSEIQNQDSELFKYLKKTSKDVFKNAVRSLLYNR